MIVSKQIDKARIFQTHRELVEVVTALKAAGEIEAYSIKAHRGGLVAGVRPRSQWTYLVEA